jgi:DNA modification methylase
MNNEINENKALSQTSVMCRAVDNLELLLSQPDESVDLIYCDILYGTGRNFGDYQDLKPIRSEIENHYLPRLIEMKRVLKQNGSIYLQMDTRINHWMRILMDDVFGYDKFRNEIIWCYTMPCKLSKYYPKKHDVILFYSKSNTYTFNNQFIPYAKSNKNNGKTSVVGYSENVATKLDERGKAVEDFWIDLSMLNSMSSERIGYQTQKPKALIERVIKASSNEGDTVADYYLGSGTTAVVCKELNRNFIGCDINPKAIEITNARLDAVS